MHVYLNKAVRYPQQGLVMGVAIELIVSDTLKYTSAFMSARKESIQSAWFKRQTSQGWPSCLSFFCRSLRVRSSPSDTALMLPATCNMN